MSDEWDRLIEAEFAQEGDEEAAEVESACMARSQSDSETDSESPGPISRLSLWWARGLFRTVTGMGIPWPNFRGMKLRVVSGCTGCSAECAALKAWC